MEQKIAPSRDLQRQAEKDQTKISYCLYARKSTESEERQVLSIDSQIKEMLSIAERENLNIIDIRRESHSAKDSGQRPVFKELLEDIKRGRFNGILTWAPDRLSRNGGDLGSIVDLMDQKLLVEIRTHGQVFTNSPNEKFLLMILGSQAKLENDNRGINVKRGLRMKCEMGLWPTCAPTGYINVRDENRRCIVIPDPDRAHIIKKMFEKVAYDHWSGRKIYHWLKFDIRFQTKGNKYLALGNIYRILQMSFYHGPFEYPRGSGNWYQGNHKPLITKEVFDLAQDQLKRDRITRDSKQFAFTKLITCCMCGSGITADEKYKKLKNGNVNSYTYYGCTRSRDLSCKLGYIREDDLIKKMLHIIDQIDINEIGLKKQFEEEVARYNRFQKSVLNTKGSSTPITTFDVKSYAKYILKEGQMSEKRELMASLQSRLVLVKDKQLILKKYETPIEK